MLMICRFEPSRLSMKHKPWLKCNKKIGGVPLAK